MSRVIVWGIRCLAPAIVFSATANAQRPTARAPVPQQVLDARRVFIGNGGGESYGADTYFHLTKFDGGPDRAYNSFYAAVKEWGHYDLVGSTDSADLVLVIRFTNPAVDRTNANATSDQPHDWIYDPQLNLSMNDPRTGLAVWHMTEHIEPADDRLVANRHFDDAVSRLVGNLQRLILDPNAASTPSVPPGAIAAQERLQRSKHAGLGLLLGSVAGGVLAGAASANGDCTVPGGNCVARAAAKGRNTLFGIAAGAVAGALIGWVWPTHVEGFPY